MKNIHTNASGQKFGPGGQKFLPMVKAFVPKVKTFFWNHFAGRSFVPSPRGVFYASALMLLLLPKISKAQDFQVPPFSFKASAGFGSEQISIGKDYYTGNVTWATAIAFDSPLSKKANYRLIYGINFEGSVNPKVAKVDNVVVVGYPIFKYGVFGGISYFNFDDKQWTLTVSAANLTKELGNEYHKYNTVFSSDFSMRDGIVVGAANVVYEYRKGEPADPYRKGEPADPNYHVEWNGRSFGMFVFPVPYLRAVEFGLGGGFESRNISSTLAFALGDSLQSTFAGANWIIPAIVQVQAGEDISLSLAGQISAKPLYDRLKAGNGKWYADNPRLVFTLAYKDNTSLSVTAYRVYGYNPDGTANRTNKIEAIRVAFSKTF